ncbi:hypothetical protein ABZ234_31940 [Nocardiopsis sp. NPDC006198]|uniref:hypothetical protein n=1 Tax=Nocardiopsis sp. NPDC006198 TaxID=3154472 RepID=UPI0033B6B302
MNTHKDDYEAYPSTGAGMGSVTDAELDALIRKGKPIVRDSGEFDAQQLEMMFSERDMDDPANRDLLRRQVHIELDLPEID